MSDYLTNSLDDAEALVDISNVVREKSLGGSSPADLARLDRVAAALADLYNDERVALFGVADRSLFDKKLFADQRQLRTLREWERDEKLLVVGKADSVLLKAGKETGLPIIAMDGYLGHRDEYPYLNERDDALLVPQADRRGNITFRHPEPDPEVSDWRLSLIQEHDVLKQQGIGEEQGEVLGHFWSCPEERCPRHEPASKPFVLLPLLRAGRIICDLHGLEMEKQEPRPRMAQLKIVRDKIVKDRFTVAEGEPVAVGRSGTGVDLFPFLDEADRKRVSRTHLRFDLDAEGLTVTDVSTNGTTLIVGGSRRGGHKELLLHHNTHPFTVGDRAEIIPGLVIVRSGRQYPSELPGRREQPPCPRPVAASDERTIC